MVVSEISTARRGIVFGVFQCCATGITDGGLPRVVFESYSAGRKDSIEKSKLVLDLVPGLNSIEKKKKN